uniref:C-C motif chemokine n=1 Tax=Gopherus evgoodei TaxID=1825980 RepID=A0A8C4WFK7_9SAUR
SKYSPATTHQKHCASPPPVLPTTSGSNDALDCCLRTSHVPIPRKIVLDYVVQRIPDGCPIHAVVFITVRGKQLCAPPHAHWVRQPQIFWLLPVPVTYLGSVCVSPLTAKAAPAASPAIS